MRFALLSIAVALACAAPANASGAKPKEGDDDRGARRITSSPLYVQMPTLTAPIARNYTFGGVLVVDVGFDVPDAKLRAKVEKMKPRLLDSLRTALAEYTHARFHEGGAPDADAIARMLQQATDTAVGQAGAQVLLVNLMVQNEH